MSYVCFECGTNIYTTYIKLNPNYKSKITDKYFSDQKPIKNDLFDKLRDCCKKRVTVFTLKNEPN